MAIALAIRAGVRDARENTYFSLDFTTNAKQWVLLLRSMWKDVVWQISYVISDKMEIFNGEEVFQCH